ncbi:MAG: hypothetical protein EXR79_13240 [Myxococcales bacterium]|nr:hypothetical protein [Myxococcales bacterium]
MELADFGSASAAALASGRPFVAVVHADWCEPCNELHMRALESAAAARALAGVEVAGVDFESAAGASVAAEWKVLGLPTTLVLRPHGTSLIEVGRIEGFDGAKDWLAAVEAALQRREPEPGRCPTDAAAFTARNLPAAVTVTDEAFAAQLECLAADLRGAAGPDAARVLQAVMDDPVRMNALARQPEPVCMRAVAAFRLLGRWRTRVQRDHARAAEVFAALQQWPGLPARAKPGALYWRARSLAKAGRGSEAFAVLQQHVTATGGALEAKELAADLLVHEHVEPARAHAWLVEVADAQPANHWAQYLLGELAMLQSNPIEAVARYETANRIQPDNALYLRHLARAKVPPPAPTRAEEGTTP